MRAGVICESISIFSKIFYILTDIHIQHIRGIWGLRVVLARFYHNRHIITRKRCSLSFIKITHILSVIYGTKPTESLKILILGIWELWVLLTRIYPLLVSGHIITRKKRHYLSFIVISLDIFLIKGDWSIMIRYRITSFVLDLHCVIKSGWI